ncbi:MAG: histidine phosphatase family protein [Lachnospiraceae bacterium]|nr:histidine phosphatase family protein [Lachnospiraceae bacterium]
MTELYILRHGTTAWNKERRLQGHSDIPLDEDGRALARETGKGMRDIHFDRCFTSPLIRARETAQIVLGDRKIPVQTDERIAERNFGIYEGKPMLQATPAVRAEIEEMMRFDLQRDYCPPEGESVSQLLERTKDFYLDITQNPAYENERILISVHGAAGRAIMHAVWGGDFWHGCVPKNCTVCIVRLEHGQVKDVQQDVEFYTSEVKEYY